MTLEVILSPAEFADLRRRDLRRTTCVVFDVLRATTSMVTALANGAAGIIPVTTIAKALAWRRRQSGVLLAGERNGLLIGSDLTGSEPFDLGNSPREFVPGRVSGKTIVMTTTNGTLALEACRGAKHVFVGSMLNLPVTARAAIKSRPSHLLVVCGGTYDQVALEDVMAAGAFCDLVWPAAKPDSISDSALIARMIYLKERRNLKAAFRRTRNGRRLLSRPQLKADVSYCVRRDTLEMVAILEKDGVVRRASIPE
jgi:2-phosphosulfolactate phosphatase